MSAVGPIDKSDATIWCPCGARRAEAYYWHDTLNHECIKHPTACRVCLTIADIEAFLKQAAEAE